MNVATGPSLEVAEVLVACVRRWGVTKTTLDDVAREARCSRATVYRSCPGGKDRLVHDVVSVRLAHLLDEVARAVTAAPTLEDALTAALVGSTRRLAAQPAFSYVLEHERALLLPHLAFHGFDRLLATTIEHLGPALAVHLDEPTARRTAEWLTRIVASHILTPSAELDLTDEAAARRYTRAHLLGGLARPAPVR
jgi:AcrR family transcriptional regulator